MLGFGTVVASLASNAPWLIALSMYKGWMFSISGVLIGLSAVLLGRAHYVLYVLKQGNWLTATTTWLATLFVSGYWAWKLLP